MFMCPRAQHIWKYALTILYLSQAIQPVQGRWAMFTWQQCVMGSRIPRKFREASGLWSLIRGSTIWLIWIDRNAICFQRDLWATQKLETMLWDAVIDHGRTAWLRTQSLIEQYPNEGGKFLDQFRSVWCQSDFFGRLEIDHMRWRHHRPHLGAFDSLY